MIIEHLFQILLPIISQRQAIPAHFSDIAQTISQTLPMVVLSPQRLPLVDLFTRATKALVIRTPSHINNGTSTAQWNEWSSLFSSTIHNNQDITDTEGTSFLQSLIIGQAKNCISGFLCNPNNNSSALQELNRCFGNPQMISVL